MTKYSKSSTVKSITRVHNPFVFMKKLIVFLVIFAAKILSGAEDMQQSRFDILLAENTLYVRIGNALTKDNPDRAKYLMQLMPHPSYRILHCYTDTDGADDAKLQQQFQIFDYCNREYLKFLTDNPGVFPAEPQVMLHTLLYLEKFAPGDSKTAAADLLKKYSPDEIKAARTAIGGIDLTGRQSTLSCRNKYVICAMLMQSYQNFIHFLPLLQNRQYPLLRQILVNLIVLNQYEIDEIVRIRPDFSGSNEYQKYLEELKKLIDATPGATAADKGNQP